MKWTLRYPGTEISFGSGLDDGFALQREPEVADYELDVDDALIPRGDGVFFGSDHFGGRTIRFDITVNAATEAEVRAKAEQVVGAWRFENGRSTPGAVAELVAPSGRLVYGRPRRISAIETNAMFGRIDLIADFQTVDANWYGEERSIAIPLASLPLSGMTSPFVAPFSTSRVSDNSVVANVVGTLGVSPVFEIHGPITNPQIEIGGNVIALSRSVAPDETVVIDTRPWVRTVMIGSRSIAGSLTASSTRLTAIRLTPGLHELALRGSSVSGSAVAVVRWRDAFATY